MEEKNRFFTYQHSEGKTIIGQAIKFTCRPEMVDQVKKFLQENVRSVDIPVTGQVCVSQGSYGMYTRYDIIQHKYAGGGHPGGGGYIEVLEIKGPPDGRWGIVIHENTSSRGSVFTEWETLDKAKDVFEKHWGIQDTTDEFLKLPGFKRRVVCGALLPWFYAIGSELLIGDYTFPADLQDDVTYRFGKQFVVFDDKGIPEIKTCVGTRYVAKKKDYYPYEEVQYRLVFWDDGSVWNEDKHYNLSPPPRPLLEGEMWITEAVSQFRKFLSGKKEKFSISLADGRKFIGRLAKTKNRTPCAEGDYFLQVRLKGEKKPKEGWIFNFKPTPENPDIIQYVKRRWAQRGEEVEYLEIKKSETKCIKTQIIDHFQLIELWLRFLK